MKYLVDIKDTSYATIEISADSKEEAESIALKEYCAGNIIWDFLENDITAREAEKKEAEEFDSRGFVARIYDLAGKNGLRIGEFEKSVCVCRGHFARTAKKNWHPGKHLLETIADKYGVSVNYLLGKE